MSRLAWFVAGIVTMAYAVAGTAWANGVAAPEIDGSSISAAIAALAAGAMMLRARRR